MKLLFKETKMEDDFGRVLNHRYNPLLHTGIDDKKEAPKVSPSEWYTFNPSDKWVITESTPQAPNPPGFILPLLPYQLSSVYVMLEIERKREFMDKNSIYMTEGATLSNPFGSGKTAVILGLISFLQKCPSAGIFTVGFNEAYWTRKNEFYEKQNRTKAKSNINMPRGVIIKKFPGTYYQPTLVFVGRNVISQWENEVKTFNPTLRLMIISDIRSLKKFYSLICKDPKQLNNFDIIIIKNEKVTGQWEFVNGEIVEHPNRGKDKRIFNVIANICRNIWFKRVVIDDFDTIKLPPILGNINALFKWYVSSTKKKQKRTAEWHNHEHTSFESLIHHNYFTVNDILCNQVLYGIFNVAISDDYYKKFITVGRPRFYYYKFDHPAGKVINLIGQMGGDKINDIMEALNGNAIGEAAKMAGVETSDPNKIFKALMQKNYERIEDAKRVIKLFDTYYNKINIDSLEAPPPNTTFGKTSIREGKPLNYKFPGIKQLLTEEEAHQRKELDNANDILNNFKSSISEDANCQICSGPLIDENENYAILPCGHEMLHAYCATRGLKFHKETCARGTEIVGACPFDRNHRVLLNEMTYIRNDVQWDQLDSILETSPDEETPPLVIEEDEKETENEKEKEEWRPRLVTTKNNTRGKMDALVELLIGNQPKEQTETHLIIPNMLVGKHRLLEPAYLNSTELYNSTDVDLPISIQNVIKLQLLTNKPKCLVFANFESTLDHAERAMKKNGINYSRLMGSSHTLNSAVAGFVNGEIDHLLLHGIEQCAGLNLQAATDLIFVHHVMEENIMRQIMGRIQRFGRQTNARIHFLLYDNEIDYVMAYKDPNPIDEIATPASVASEESDDSSDDDS
jgi:SNF2 family DNA or RNA helicase